MFEKILVAHRREIAVRVMRAALGECVVEGVKTDIPLRLRILDHPDFLAGSTHGKFLEQVFASEARAG